MNMLLSTGNLADFISCQDIDDRRKIFVKKIIVSICGNNLFLVALWLWLAGFCEKNSDDLVFRQNFYCKSMNCEGAIKKRRLFFGNDYCIHLPSPSDFLLLSG